MAEFHQFDRFNIPVCTGRSANHLYNMRPDEIDQLRTGTEGVFEPDGFRGTPFAARFSYMSDQECKEICEFQKAKQCSAIHLMTDNGVPVKDQNGHGYCWAYGAISAVEVSRLMQGLPYTELSPHSVAAGYMKGADRGGWASMAYEWAQKHGIVPDSLWPRHSRDYRLWDKPEIAAAAEQYKPLEVIDIDEGDMQAVRTLICQGLACGLGLMWWGHLICFAILDYSPKYGWLYGERNSHGPRFGLEGWAWHTESSAKHGGGSACIVA